MLLESPSLLQKPTAPSKDPIPTIAPSYMQNPLKSHQVCCRVPKLLHNPHYPQPYPKHSTTYFVFPYFYCGSIIFFLLLLGQRRFWKNLFGPGLNKVENHWNTQPRRLRNIIQVNGIGQHQYVTMLINENLSEPSLLQDGAPEGRRLLHQLGWPQKDTHPRR